MEETERTRACLVTVSNDFLSRVLLSPTQGIIVKLKGKAMKEASFGLKRFVHSLKCKSRTQYSDGVKGYDQV